MERLLLSLREGKSHLAPLTRLGGECSPLKIGGEVAERSLGGEAVGRKRAHLIASLAIEEALTSARGRRADLSLEKTGFALGTALGPVEEVEDWVGSGEPLSFERMTEMSFETFAARLSQFGESADPARLGGPRSVFSVTCVSGICALEQAAAEVALDRAESMVVGAVDTLSGVMVAGFSSLQALSPSGRLRPFDVEHDGIVIGEAAAFVILEPLAAAEEREASAPACLLSQRLMSDCCHLTSADPSGEVMAEAISSVLTDAGLGAEDIGCITVTAIGSPLYDRMLSLAVERALGDVGRTIPTTSFEPAVGHVLAATGTLALAHATMLIREKEIFPSFSVDHVAPYCRLSYVQGSSIPLASPVVLAIVVGFGGQNGVLLVSGSELASRICRRN